MTLREPEHDERHRNSIASRAQPPVVLTTSLVA